MSKKESESDRFNRVRKMEREAEALKRKVLDTENKKKRVGKPTAEEIVRGRQNWNKEYLDNYEEVYEYI